MSAWRLILAGLRHFWRTQAGVALGCAVGTAVLVGALAVGDSVRHSLRAQALARIGRVDAVLASGERLFRAELAGEMAARMGGLRLAPVLHVRASASTPDARARANGVDVLGVDGRFFELGPSGRMLAPPAGGEVLLNERLARQLAARAGEEIVLRVELPSALPRDVVLAASEEAVFALRLAVAGVLSDREFGRFGLNASQVPPFDACVSLAWLQEQLDLSGRANLMLVDAGEDGAAAARAADAVLRASWELADAELELRALDDPRVLELRSRRVFLDAAVVDAIEGSDVPSVGVLTWFVNEIESGGRTTPYSLVAAIGPPVAGLPTEGLPSLHGEALAPSAWLVADLGHDGGEPFELAYFVLGPDRRLVEERATFQGASPVERAGWAADRELMPDFPGLADVDDCADWEPGVPIDLARIRDQDEEYWDLYRGTPKAFVSLAAGERMWANRFGTRTALRLPVGAEERVRALLRDELDPRSVGLFFRDVRTPALAASASATDFGRLFLALSAFLIAAALLLTGLLFALGAEQRAREIGTLLALGLRPGTVRRLFLGEAALLALLGGAAGALAGLGYTRLVLAGLASVWSGAVGATSIELFVRPGTLALGTLASVLAALGAMLLALRRLVTRPALELLSGAVALPRARPARFAPAVALLAALGAGGVLLGAGGGEGTGAAAAGAFFGAGALLLVAGLAAGRALLPRVGRGARLERATLAGLGRQNGARRPRRSMATVALLACGAFLVLSVGVFRKHTAAGPGERASGTGGFALYGRSSIGLPRDVGAESGRGAFALAAHAARDVSIVPLRVRAGDDASCLNLSLPQEPRLVGVRPDELARRGAFTFAHVEADLARDLHGASPWTLLGRELEGDTVPVIGDQASVQWSLHEEVGGEIDYTDERGRPFRARIVATVASSILQGDLLMSEERFVEHFPSISGYRAVLVDAPPQGAAIVSAELTRALADFGLELTPSAERLAELDAVQNTYLAIFQVLGGLGLLLGVVGLGTVVLRNALERRGELALLRAVGFRLADVRRVVLSEHALLLALGLTIGCAAALVALLPSLRAAGAGAPWAGALLLSLALALNGLVWVWLASGLAVRGGLLDALREE